MNVHSKISAKVLNRTSSITKLNSTKNHPLKNTTPKYKTKKAVKAPKADPFSQKFEKYNLTNLSYKISKETKLVNQGNSFLKRNAHDITQRINKRNIINEKLEETKPRINLQQQVNTFNRLIKDANRRHEARVS